MIEITEEMVAAGMTAMHRHWDWDESEMDADELKMRREEVRAVLEAALASVPPADGLGPAEDSLEAAGPYDLAMLMVCMKALLSLTAKARGYAREVYSVAPRAWFDEIAINLEDAETGVQSWLDHAALSTQQALASAKGQG